MKRIKVGDIASHGVITVLPTVSLQEAVSVMAHEGVSCIVISTGKLPEGILTERDAVRLSSAYASKPELLKTTAIADVMTSPVCTSSEKIDIYEAYHIFASNKIRHLITVDANGFLSGVVTQSDIIRSLGLELDEVRKVYKVMTSNPISVECGSMVVDAVISMSKHGVSCLLVEDENQKPAGIISERDVARLIEQLIDMSVTPVDDVMSHPIITIDELAPIHEAARIMYRRRIRRLVVVDGEGELAGLITQSDIVKGVLEGKYIESLQQIIRKKDESLSKMESTLIEKTIFLESILYSGMELGIVAIDMEYNISYMNKASVEMFGRDARDMLGRSLLDIHKEEGLRPERLLDAIAEVKEHGEYTSIIEIIRNDNMRILELRLSPITNVWVMNDEPHGYVLMAKDVTQRQIEENMLRNSEKRYRSLFESSKDMVYITSIDGKFLDVNQAGCEMLGFAKKELLSTNLIKIYKNPKERDEFIRIIEANNYVKDYEIDFISKNGDVVNGLVTAALQKNQSGEVIGFQGIIRDVTERKKTEEIISFMAYHDALTGLPNRRTFTERLEREIALANRNSWLSVVLFIDLDGFKDVNDSYGHDVGDLVLQLVADEIKDCLRVTDTAARIGGDEFVAILSNIASNEQAVVVAKSILARFAKPKTLGGNSIKIGMSIGISSYPADGKDPEQLLQKADKAMYAAKAAGKGMVIVYKDKAKP